MRILFVVITFLCLVIQANAAEYVEKIESEVYEIKQSKSSIMKQAETCIMQHIHNDAVMLAGSSSGFSGMFSGKTNKSTNYIQAGDIIRHKDVEKGIIYANSRVDIKSYMVAYSVQSSVNLMVKEGKFKVRHSDIKYLQKDVGYGTNKGYKKLRVDYHAAKKAIAALKDVTKKIVTCVQNSSKEDDW